MTYSVSGSNYNKNFESFITLLEDHQQIHYQQVEKARQGNSPSVSVYKAAQEHQELIQNKMKELFKQMEEQKQSSSFFHEEIKKAYVAKIKARVIEGRSHQVNKEIFEINSIINASLRSLGTYSLAKDIQDGCASIPENVVLLWLEDEVKSAFETRYFKRSLENLLSASLDKISDKEIDNWINQQVDELSKRFDYFIDSYLLIKGYPVDATSSKDLKVLRQTTQNTFIKSFLLSCFKEKRSEIINFATKVDMVSIVHEKKPKLGIGLFKDAIVTKMHEIVANMYKVSPEMKLVASVASTLSKQIIQTYASKIKTGSIHLHKVLGEIVKTHEQLISQLHYVIKNSPHEQDKEIAKLLLQEVEEAPKEAVLVWLNKEVKYLFDTKYFERSLTSLLQIPLDISSEKDIDSWINQQADELTKRFDDVINSYFVVMGFPIDKWTGEQLIAEKQKVRDTLIQPALLSLLKEKKDILINFAATAQTTSNMSPFYSIDATYHVNPENNGIVDLSYADNSVGYVVDGAGHDNPIMRTALVKIFDNFNQNYKKEFAKQQFSSIDEAKQFLEAQLNLLAQTIRTDTSPIDKNGRTFSEAFLDKSPAISFAQVIDIKGKKYLLSSQLADTALVIQRANGVFDTSLIAKRPPNGIGDPSAGIKVDITSIEFGDKIIGFSDGIGEFLTLAECKQIIKDNTDPSQLLSEFTAKIMDKAKRFSEEKSQGIKDILSHYQAENLLSVDECMDLIYGNITRDSIFETKAKHHMLSREEERQLANVVNTLYDRREDIETVNKNPFIKYQSYSNAAYHDDISIFVLPVLPQKK